MFVGEAIGVGSRNCRIGASERPMIGSLLLSRRVRVV
jgi:hypothetical protein